MKGRIGLAVPLALGLAIAAQPAMAEKGDWMLHLRAIHRTLPS